MNSSQELWWKQAKSDHDTFLLLREKGVPECHLLHYLQMITEKIAKAYFWRSASPHKKSHAGFVPFLRMLGRFPGRDQERIATIFNFNKFASFQVQIHNILPIAYELERLAPSLSNDGPNPEYPWPHQQPESAPVNYKFDVWTDLKNTSNGRRLMNVIENSINRFSEYADI